MSDPAEFCGSNEPDFDLSALSYPQFLAFFFDRPVVSSDETYDLFRSGVDSFMASNPAIVVSHLHAMCRNHADLAKVYSGEQLDQGLWAVFGAGITCEQYLFDPSVDLRSRLDCIESMVLPFRDVVANSAIEKKNSFYFMWWDMILHTFWGDAFPAAGDKYQALPADGRQLAEAICETLLKILAIDHIACQWSALHGLGHLHHPRGRGAVQSYLDSHRTELSGEDVDWIERCREGRIA